VEDLPQIYGDSLGTEIFDAQSGAIAPVGPWDGDIPFFRRLAAKLGGPVLEIGCGTGRVAAALAADGFEVVGIDRSAPMLRLAEERRATLSPDARGRLSFVQEDMTAFDLGREFALVVAPSRVFQFALTSDAQRGALRTFKAHLREDGRIVLDLFDPLLEFVAPGSTFPPRTGELIHPKTGNRVRWEIVGREPDPAAQLVISDWSAREIGPRGEVLRDETERLTVRWTTRSEMRLLFELEGLEVEAEHGDFAGGPPAYGAEQVWVLRSRTA
jgi:SAM-dependent methyltransferase